MKILQANKFYYINGGSEQYMFNLCELLRRHGHEILSFSMKDPRNFKSEFERFFIRQIDYNRSKESIFRKAHVACRTLYSLEARGNLDSLLKTCRVDVAHLHNFSYHLTPSILQPLKKRQVPVVQTLHDYHIICPSHNLYDFERQEVCEDCQGKHFGRAVGRRCIKGSRLMSMIGCLEGYLANRLGTYNTKIDRFISPSRFLRDKVVEHGVASEKVAYIPNFVDPQDFEPHFEGSNYFVYFGRIEEFKGIRTVILAFSGVPDGSLYVLGNGSLLAELKKTVKESPLGNVRFLGFQQGIELKKIVSKSLCTLCPSEWYENNPLSILESFALGKPVIGAAIGGIPELVEDGVTGLLFRPGDADELAEKIDYCLTHRAQVIRMGREARRRIEKIYNPKVHYQRIHELYTEMIQ